MRTTIRKAGSGASVRIPSSVLKAARLRIGEGVDIRAESGRVVIESATRPPCDINALVARITRSNRHDEADLGRPVGRELL